MNKAVMSAHVPPPPRPWESSSWLWVTNTLGVFHHIASLTSSPSFVWTFFLHQQQLDYKSDRKTAETGGLLIPGRVIKKIWSVKTWKRLPVLFCSVFARGKSNFLVSLRCLHKFKFQQENVSKNTSTVTEILLQPSLARNFDHACDCI